MAHAGRHRTESPREVESRVYQWNFEFSRGQCVRRSNGEYGFTASDAFIESGVVYVHLIAVDEPVRLVDCTACNYPGRNQ